MKCINADNIDADGLSVSSVLVLAEEKERSLLLFSPRRKPGLEAEGERDENPTFTL